MVVGARQGFAGIFPKQSSQGSGNDMKRRKYPVSGSSLCENALFMSEVRGELSDWSELIVSKITTL